jgi:hypothetical protein
VRLVDAGIESPCRPGGLARRCIVWNNDVLMRRRWIGSLFSLARVLLDLLVDAERGLRPVSRTDEALDRPLRFPDPLPIRAS